MEPLIRTVLSKYTGYVAEEKLLNRWLCNRENTEMRQALTLLGMKITSIHSWFNLLNEDEKFVVQKHLIDELEWPRVAFEFTERWRGEFSRTERSLLHYQASALRKIGAFCQNNREITMALFGALEDETKDKIP